MRIRERISAAVKTFKASPGNWLYRIADATAVFFTPSAFYEAGRRWTPDRMTLPGAVQDARFDATSAARVEIMRKARYFEKNNAIAQRIGSVFADYTVGATGLVLIPASSDSDWNTRAKAYWDASSLFIDLNSRQNFGTLQGLIAWRWLFDGEIFILKTRGKSSNGKTFPRIQLIESHRVGTPPKRQADEGKTVIDGVEIDSDGRPTGYWVKDSSDSDTYRFIDAQNIIHVFEPSRPGEYRGISFFHAAINYLHALDDLQVLEFRSATSQSEAATFITNATGELDRAALRAARVSGTTTGVDGDRAFEERIKFYRDTYGGRIFAGKTGETFTHVAPNRPSESTRALWSYLTSCVCAAIGIPKVICFSEWLDQMQGTIVRGDYDIASQFFRARSAVIQAACREVYIYCIGWGIRSDVSIADPPADWFKVTIRPPRAPNVDVGRNDSAESQSLRDGRTNYDLIYGPRGLDWKEELTKRADEVAFVKQLAVERGLEPAEITELTPPDPQPTPVPVTTDDDE